MPEIGNIHKYKHESGNLEDLCAVSIMKDDN